MIRMNESSKYIQGTRTKMLKDITNLEEELRIVPIYRESLNNKTEKWSDEEMARYRWLLQDWKSREGGNGT
jgi:hypothetical protein